MILLNKEQIKYLHNKMIQETGGSNGIRDEGLLDSALSAPFQSECSEEELIALGLGIASGKIEEKDVGIWIMKHNRGE